MTLWLDNILRKYKGSRAKYERGIEICAGMGRNMQILTKHCKEVHAIEQVEELADKFHDKVFNGVRVHAFVTRLQNFAWKPSSYDLLTGIWCLCYLSHKDIELLLKSVA